MFLKKPPRDMTAMQVSYQGPNERCHFKRILQKGEKKLKEITDNVKVKIET